MPSYPNKRYYGPTQDGLYRSLLEVGMPLTGQNNLAEGPLLQQLGHVRWEHLAAILGVPTRQIIDDKGERVYATFFFVEMDFPDALPINSFVENDQIEILSTLRKHSTFLDGEHFLFPAAWPAEKKKLPLNYVDALSSGIPAVRMGNSFVVQHRGADWLKKALPAADLSGIPDSALPNYFEAFSAAKLSGSFVSTLPDSRPLTADEVVTMYDIVPERDVNGVGLLYFANYPVIADICERQVLTAIWGDNPNTTELMAQRTLVQRRSGYFGNANLRDKIRVTTKAWIRTDEKRDGDTHNHYLSISSKMNRQSDGRLMYVTFARKLIKHRRQDLSKDD